MLFQLLTIKRLKCSTAAVQGIQFCKISMLASQIAPSDPVGGHPCVFRHRTGSLFPKRIEIELAFLDMGEGPVQEILHTDTVPDLSIQGPNGKGAGIPFLGPDG